MKENDIESCILALDENFVIAGAEEIPILDAKRESKM